ncbi:MAG: hypothetical protein OXH53_07420, partial [bacterium]|nr:hypothetical protein [bacterium]
IEGDLEDDLDGDLDDDLDEEEEEEEAENGSARGSNMSEDEDGDAEDIDPDNVEADLDTILKDRLAAGDDEDEETPEPLPEAAGQVAPKRDNEWTCEGCFLIVSSSQFGPRDNPRCPSGEEPCPSLARL